MSSSSATNNSSSGTNNTTNAVNNNTVQPVTATIKSRPTIMPSSYGYTSSSGLLGGTKPVPPPKFTGNFTTGLTATKDGTTTPLSGGSYRLTVAERLSMRQKFLNQSEQQQNGSTPSPTATTTTENNGSSSTQQQSKREMFFSNNHQVISPPTEVATVLKKPQNGTVLEPNTTASVVVENKKTERPKPKELDGYVGFANLPNQVYRKAVKKGFEFTLMVVGESGLGKSTLINSMFLTDIYGGVDGSYPGPTQRVKKTVCVETTRVLLKENGVNLTLTMVDTPGFGDAVDNSNCWQPIIDYVETKYEDYLNSEARVTRNLNVDQRVHCCLYFIQPSGHGLKSLDVECMKRLCDKVNIVPVVAKADTLTEDECAQFKRQIMSEIAQHKIKIYEFPDDVEEQNDNDDDVDEFEKSANLRRRVPFAVVGSNTVLEVDGVKVRGRRYPWGVAQVENLAHCDFLALRNMIVRTHLQDLKDVTNNVHYENYRCRKLAGLGVDGKPTRVSNKNPLAQMDEEKREHDAKMKKMEAEMEQVFEMKVCEKKQKLKDSEMELTRRHETTKKQLEQQAKELEEKRRAFQIEKEQWEKENQITIEELRRRSLDNSREMVDGKKKKKGLF